MIQENNAFEQYRANLCRVLTQGKLLSAVETSLSNRLYETTCKIYFRAVLEMF